MQRIERYGVIALVLLLVTIAAVSFWDDGKTDTETDSTETAGAQANAQRENQVNNNKRTAPKQELGNGQLPNTAQRGVSEAAARTQAAIAEANRTAQLNRNNLARKSAQSEPKKKASFETLPAKTLSAKTQQGGENLAQRGYNRDENGQQYGGSNDEEVAFPDLPARGSDAERQAMANSMHTSNGRDQSSKVQEQVQLSPKRNESSHAQSASTYVVQPGDTLSQIAYVQLGTSKRWPEIQALNGGLDPSAIHVGLELKLPERSSAPVSLNLETVARRSVSTFVPVDPDGGNYYTVKKGDVLSQISEDQLGSSRRWKEIAELNPSINPNVLLEGKRLRMPAASVQVSAVTPTSKPSLVPVSKSSKNRVR